MVLFPKFSASYLQEYLYTGNDYYIYSRQEDNIAACTGRIALLNRLAPSFSKIQSW